MPKQETEETRATRRARDAAICDQYRGGVPAAKIAAGVGLTPGRVHQILQSNGFRGADRPNRHNGRDEFLGLELEGRTKAALRQEAERRGVSLSPLSADTLREMLVACGYPLEARRVL